ncbi:MAG TPA: oxidoreductase [Ktedonobacteraceae bacterium]|nr:oxidoreductase [Ktedonobacteraceae bacterium]
MSQWTVNNIPDLQGHVALVTGANSGLGLETTSALAAKGAHVIMAARNPDKAREAKKLIETKVPRASLEIAQLDLASLASVRAFAADFLSSHERLDLLFNNAGVMAIPRCETQDGFEMQCGTNHLGHFALTGLLLPVLLTTAQSRVITTSSIARYAGRINLDDLNSERAYARWGAYGQSKRANLLFAFELQSRLTQAGATTISVAAHPGYANTALQTTSVAASNSALERFFYGSLGSFAGQSAAMGALPQLYAATAPYIYGGELVGPSGFFGMRGYPRVEAKARREYDRTLAARLWDASVKLTNVDYASLRSESVPEPLA